VRELREILGRARALAATGEPAALATIVAVAGSSYRREGARMLLEPGGRATGVLSGGCLERDLARTAGEALAAGTPRTLVYDLRAEEEAIWGFGLGCAGRVTLLVEPLAGAAAEALVAMLACAIEARREAPHHPRRDRLFVLGLHRRACRRAVGLRSRDTGSGTRAHRLAHHRSQRVGRLARRERALADLERHGRRARRAARRVAPAAAASPGHRRRARCRAPPPARPGARLANERRSLVRPDTAAEARVAPCARSSVVAPRALAAAVVSASTRARGASSPRIAISTISFVSRSSRAPDRRSAISRCSARPQRRERLLADLTRRRGGAASPRTPLRGPAGLDLGGRSPGEIALAIVAEVQAELHAGSGRPLAEKPERASREPAERSP
jgi:xanthine dehydrogenase accessory factor